MLLDRQDKIQSAITSTTNRIFWAKNVSGVSFVDSNNKLFHNTVLISFKYVTLAQAEVDVQNKFMAIPHNGTLILNDVTPRFRLPGTANTIIQIGLSLRNPAVGANVTVLMYKNGVTTGQTATLTTGSGNQEITNITDVSVTSSDVIHFEITQIGTTTVGEDLIIYPYYT